MKTQKRLRWRVCEIIKFCGLQLSKHSRTAERLHSTSALHINSPSSQPKIEISEMGFRKNAREDKTRQHKNVFMLSAQQQVTRPEFYDRSDRERLCAFFFARLSLPLLSRHVRNNFSGRDSRRRRLSSSTNRGNLYYVNVLTRTSWWDKNSFPCAGGSQESRFRGSDMFLVFADVELCFL